MPRSLVVAAALCATAGVTAGAHAQATDPPAPSTPPEPTQTANPPPAAPEAPATEGEAKPADDKDKAEKSDKQAEPPKEDDKVGFKWVYLVPEVGYASVNLKSFSETDLAVVDSEKGGAMAGVGAGVRLIFLTLGVRARRYFAMEMWQVGADVGLHLKVNRIDPYIAFRGGYDTIGSDFTQAVGGATGTTKLDVHGANAGGALGLDYFVADNFTLGGEAGGDVLFLTRPPTPLPAGLTKEQRALIENNPLYKNSGSSVGFSYALVLRLGLHF